MLKNILNAGLVAVLLSLVSCASKKEGMKDKKAELYFGAGTQSLMAAEYTEALTSLLKANELEPNNSEILNNLGMAYFFKGEEELAVKHLNAALKIDPKNSDARLNLASIYYRQGDIDRSEATYKKVLKDLTYDKQARTYYNLGVLEADKRNNVVRAQDYLARAIKEDSNYCAAYFKLANIQYKSHQFKAAAKNYKEASSGVCYSTPDAHYELALTYMQLKEFDEARLKFQDIEQHFPKTTAAVRARSKIIELNSIENQYQSLDARSPRKVLEAPAF